MVDIIIATHGPLAKALKDTSELILGHMANIKTLGLFHGDSPEEFRQELFYMIDNSKNDLLILTDIYGGTPCNSILNKLFLLQFPENIKCFVGVNMPLLLEVIPVCNNSNIDDVVNIIYRIKKDIVFDASTKFSISKH